MQKLWMLPLATVAAAALCGAAPAPQAPAPAPAWTATYTVLNAPSRTFILSSDGSASLRVNGGAPVAVHIAPAAFAAIDASIAHLDGSRWQSLESRHAFAGDQVALISTDTAMPMFSGLTADGSQVVPANMDPIARPAPVAALTQLPRTLIVRRTAADGTVAVWTAHWQPFVPTAEPPAALDLGDRIAAAFGD